MISGPNEHRVLRVRVQKKSDLLSGPARAPTVAGVLFCKPYEILEVTPAIKVKATGPVSRSIPSPIPCSIKISLTIRVKVSISVICYNLRNQITPIATSRDLLLNPAP